ncbi:YqaE/Pmp3 family membrane protein [Tateyamaria armeniaca]|uniref:YqaE/Pmp3 family membrane protein n=1 Tax=Tateyamaria armeniaca TaxID=2518930 RepID=A0ABW8UVW8_9RHOB
MKLLLIIIALILPPVAVAILLGFGKQFWLNVLLTLLFFLPGTVHAIWIVSVHAHRRAAR